MRDLACVFGNELFVRSEPCRGERDGGGNARLGSFVEGFHYYGGETDSVPLRTADLKGLTSRELRNLGWRNLTLKLTGGKWLEIRD